MYVLHAALVIGGHDLGLLGQGRPVASKKRMSVSCSNDKCFGTAFACWRRVESSFSRRKRTYYYRRLRRDVHRHKPLNELIDRHRVVLACLLACLRAKQDGNKELSETLYNMLLAGNRAPSLSAANAVVKGSKTIEEALVRVEKV